MILTNLSVAWQDVNFLYLVINVVKSSFYVQSKLLLFRKTGAGGEVNKF